MTEQELIFDSITVEDFKQGVHKLLGWNMQPLTTAEILKSGDALHCPTCKKSRYLMWKAATADLVIPLVNMNGYCVCPEQEVSNA